MTIVLQRKITIWPMRFLLVLVFLIINCYCYCQIDCKSIFENYENTIDTTKRPVYSFVETMPNIMIGSNIMHFFSNKIALLDSSKCFPIYVYYGFVVEPDRSISNVMICPTLMFCEKDERISLEEQYYIKRLTAEILKIETNAGISNGKNVAVFTKGKIHFDPQR